MARDLTIDVENEINSESIFAIYLVKLSFDSGDITVNSAIGNISFNGDTYLGIGQFGTISALEEDTELQASDVSLTLSGIDTALISTMFNEHYQCLRRGRYY